jgi:uncharacterized membrane protein
MIILLIALRWLHLVAAITLVGGTIFLRFALVPAVVVLPEGERETLRAQVRRRWTILIMASITFLLISGFVNFFLFLRSANPEIPAWSEWRKSYYGLYNMIWGIKFLIAMVIFFIASALAGRGKATQKLRDNPERWLTINLVLALIVVALSGILRYTHTGPTLPPATSAVETGGGNG